MNPKINVILRKDDIDPGFLFEKVVVLIDVLGSTSMISQAFESGAGTVHLKHDELAAQSQVRQLESQGRTQQRVIANSCGYACSQQVAGARHVYAAALLNAPAVVEKLLRHDGLSISFVCTRSGSGLSLVDLYAAGYMIDLMQRQRPGVWTHTEDSKVALAVFERYQGAPLDCLPGMPITARQRLDAIHAIEALGAHDNVPEQIGQGVFVDSRSAQGLAAGAKA